MDEEQKNAMRERFKAAIRHAEGMIQLIDEYRFAFKDVNDTRSDKEVMDEQKQMRMRMIESYTAYLDTLDGRDTKLRFIRIGNN